MTSADRPAARANLPVHIYRLGEEPPDDLLATTTPAQRLEMVAELSARVFEIAGHPAPSYARKDIPVRVIRQP